jgi:hypothetical protein
MLHFDSCSMKAAGLDCKSKECSMGHKFRQSELIYLIDDITRDLDRLANQSELEFYDMSLVGQARLKLITLRPMQVGTAEVLDSLQYLLGEIRTGHDEWDPTYIQVDRIISYIQDYLDWLASSDQLKRSNL